MMRLFIVAWAFLSITTTFGQKVNVEYDSTLAKSLGADHYGMKSYIFVLLKTGGKTIENKSQRDSLFNGHLKNINRLAKEGLLTVAGPLGKNEMNYRGIFILNVKTIEEAQALVETDPAIKAELLKAELFKWYGSAALPEYLKAHRKIEKFSIGNE